MTKRLPLKEKLNRKPTARACTFCHAKHLQCSHDRPCKNCVKRGLADGCFDVVRKRAKYLRKVKVEGVEVDGVDMSQNWESSSEDEQDGNDSMEGDETKSASVQIGGTQGTSSLPTVTLTSSAPPLEPNSNTPSEVTVPVITSLPSKMLDTTNDVLDKLLYRSINKQDSDTQNSSPALRHSFSSTYLNQEYLMLGDIILSKPSSPSASDNTSTASPFQGQGQGQAHGQGHSSHHSGSRHHQPANFQSSRPFISLGYEKEGEYVSPLISHHIYQTVQDIYSNNVVAFDYPQSYHSLTFFLKKRFSGNDLPVIERQQKRNNLLVILKLIASYRPTFISAHKSLLDPFDLQFLEMSFQRCLIDYERLSQLNSSPTIIWRRTGEIVSITDDLLSILGYNLADILSKRTFIVELMHDDESIVKYYRLFKSVAVGNLHSSIITKCKLVKGSAGAANNGDSFIEFCCVWTVKRDLFDLPMLIVGQFLPILAVGEGVRMY